jgi:cell division protein FtsB
MVQHINLLSKRRTRKGLMAVALVLLGLWALALAAMAVSGEWRLQQHRSQLAQVRQSVGELKATLEKKRQEVGLSNSEATAKQVALLRSQLDARREWADLLQKGELGQPGGYAQWFETLAMVHVEGAWLQGLDIGRAGQSVSITGKSLNADAVLRYIEQLNEAFKPMNVRFSAMEITQDAAAGDSVSARQAAALSFKIQ